MCGCGDAVQTEEGDEAEASLSTITAAKLSSGEMLPTFWVQALDRWGNCTAPAQDLPCNLIMACDGLLSSPITASFDAVGVAKIKGAALLCRQAACCMTAWPSTLITHTLVLVHPLREECCLANEEDRLRSVLEMALIFLKSRKLVCLRRDIIVVMQMAQG